MHPELTLFWWNIDLYRFFFFGGWLTVIFLSFFFLSKQWFARSKLVILAIITSISALIWARIFHFILYQDIYDQNPELLLNLDMQWQAVIGGLIMAYISVYLTSRFFTWNHWRLLDIIAPIMGLGLVIGRIGCLLAGCCFWRETDLPIWITFPLFSPAHKYQLSGNIGQIFSSHPVHPTQIYEMIIGFIMILVWIYLLRKPQKDGVVILSVSLIYFTFRLLDNYLRAPAMVYTVPPWFYPTLYIALIWLTAIGLWKKMR